jgi:hypothetical protein
MSSPISETTLDLERMLDSTLDSRLGFACTTTTTKLKPLQVENYK